VRGWSGGLGMLILRKADEVLQKTGVLPEQIKPTKTLADIPIIKGFVVRYPSAGAESVQRFYENYNAAFSVYQSIKYLEKEGKTQEANEAILKNPAALLAFSSNLFLSKQIKSVRRALGNVHNYIDKVYANPAIDPNEKKRLINKSYLDMIKIAKHGNRMFKNIGKLGKQKKIKQ
jgi:hypothetical protein